MDQLRWAALVTVGVIVLLFAVSWNVGRARGKYGIQPPATSGHPAFDRAFRVQMNTLENAVAFLPALWLFAMYVSGVWVGGVRHHLADRARLVRPSRIKKRQRRAGRFHHRIRCVHGPRPWARLLVLRGCSFISAPAPDHLPPVAMSRQSASFSRNRDSGIGKKVWCINMLAAGTASALMRASRLQNF